MKNLTSSSSFNLKLHESPKNAQDVLSRVNSTLASKKSLEVSGFNSLYDFKDIKYKFNKQRRSPLGSTPRSEEN